MYFTLQRGRVTRTLGYSTKPAQNRDAAWSFALRFASELER